MLTPTVQEVPITREGCRAVDPAVIALRAQWAAATSSPPAFLATATVDLRSDR